LSTYLAQCPQGCPQKEKEIHRVIHFLHTGVWP